MRISLNERGPQVSANQLAVRCNPCRRWLTCLVETSSKSPHMRISRPICGIVPVRHLAAHETPRCKWCGPLPWPNAIPEAADSYNVGFHWASRWSKMPCGGIADFPHVSRLGIMFVSFQGDNLTTSLRMSKSDFAHECPPLDYLHAYSGDIHMEPPRPGQYKRTQLQAHRSQQ